MKKLDNIRTSQNQRQEKNKMKSMKKQKRLSRSTPAFRAFVTVLKIFVLLMFITAALGGVWVYSQMDFSFGDDFTTFDLRLSSTIYCRNEYGEYVEYEQFKSDEKRIWVDIEDVCQDMQDAFVAIEDQRFYDHNGVDLKRTLGAVINVFVKGDSSYGGSTITQQLVKNITEDNERTNARKIREMMRSIVLETKMEKSEILEMYMNSIYLSQGVHGVQAAANLYFDKDASELSLAESACIAGITQYPTTYDPIINPENNKKKQLTVLSKMLELGYINQKEYDEAVSEELKFAKGNKSESGELSDESQSYFADFIFEQAKQDLMKEFGYTDSFTEDFLCNGGLKIYATVDPSVQSVMEEYYENTNNFPSYGSEAPQSAMVVMEPSTGEIKGIVGGRGKKEGNRVLNRASQSKRQPGSSIKPIAVYAPALEENVVNLSSYISNNKITINGWTPKNSNGKYTGPVTIKNAVAYSYNIPAINVLQELGIDKSFDYLKNKLHINSIVDKEERNNKVYSDKNLSSLALGGLTDGVTPLEMTAAYSAIANGGIYIEPTSYTKIFDKNDTLFFEKKPVKTKAFSEETAFLTQQLLSNVVKYGTAAGSIIGSNDTGGKTGTTDDNKDKWFMGFTPHYCAGVWYGYDAPKVVSSGTNPSLVIWKKIMTEIHEELGTEKFDVPDGIIQAKLCPYTGQHESYYSFGKEYANKKFLTGYCGGKNHSKYIGWENDKNISLIEKSDDDEEEEEKTEGENGDPETDDSSKSEEQGDNSSNNGSASSDEGQTSGNDSGQSGNSSQTPTPQAPVTEETAPAVTIAPPSQI